MKLTEKISRYYLINSTIIFLAALIGTYFIINAVLSEETDEQLLLNRTEITDKIQDGIQVSNPPFIEVKKDSINFSDKILLSDTVIYLKTENELEPFRQAVSYFKYKGEYYKLVLRTSIFEKEDLLYTLLIIFSLVFVLLILTLNIINRKTTAKIFSPFYANLDLLKNFRIKSGKELQLQASDIEEFIELNSALKVLAGKAGKDYKALKEFTEDLSHELQTPVSIIKNKLELLLQKNFSDEGMLEDVQKAYQNINKLDKVNRALVMLSKLESKDFFETSHCNLAEIINKVVDNYSDIAEVRGIIISTDISGNNLVMGNETLLETTVSNLISNAIKHNYNNGKILINLNNAVMLISNTGEDKPLNTEEIFNRFSKNISSSESIGLGLAIIKKICSLFEYKINYYYKNDMHTMEISFR